MPSNLRCIVVTPERIVLDREAYFVVVPLYDGELGVAPSHSPIIGRLGYGELRLDTGRGFDRYYIEGGFVEVLDDTVSLITTRAIPAAQIDELAAREELEAARQRPAHSAELLAIRDRAVNRARAQIRIARRSPK